MSCTLERSEEEDRQRWLRIAVASLTFVLANLIDYRLTIYGLTYTRLREANPVIQGYMDLFGMTRGLLLYKGLMVSMIILASVTLDLAYRNKGFKHIPEYILYPGAILTTAASSLWLVPVLS